MDYKDLARTISQFYRDNPDSWCQGVLARDRLDIRTGALSETARKWCLLGITIKFDPAPFPDSTREILQCKIASRIGVIPHWNDAPERTVDEVVSLLETIACE